MTGGLWCQTMLELGEKILCLKVHRFVYLKYVVLSEYDPLKLSLYTFHSSIGGGGGLYFCGQTHWVGKVNT